MRVLHLETSDIGGKILIGLNGVDVEAIATGEAKDYSRNRATVTRQDTIDKLLDKLIEACHVLYSNR